MKIPRIGRVAAGLGVVSSIVVLWLPACRTKPANTRSGGFVNARDFKDAPPEVERATLQPLNRGVSANARLEVVFDARDSRVKESVPIMVAGKKIVLRDDGTNGDVKVGDRKFSAMIDFDFREELAAQAGAAARALEKPQPRPLFRGREIIGVEDSAAMQARWRRLIANRDLDKFFGERRTLNLFDFISVIDPASIDPARSLMITDPLVVQDPTRTIDPCNPASGNANGVWTFKHLVTEMVAGTGVDPADFVEKWLKLWLTNQTVSSGFSAESRVSMQASILAVWPRTAAGKLNLDRSPFRLSAIVNRIDLGDSFVYGGGSAGEMRFVFGVQDKTLPDCHFFPFSVIFEYGVPGSSCDEVRSWAKQWVDLTMHSIGSPAYNGALAAMTVQITKANAVPGKPNGSALNQLRTNERALSNLFRDPPWELREFRLDVATHLLVQDTVKQTPDESLNTSSVIAQFVNENAAAIKADQHLVPDRFPGTTPLLGASSLATAGSELTTHFSAPGILDNDARFHLSLNTCAACHIRETGTVSSPNGNTAFLHVDPRTMPATLSRFLTGATDSVSDSPDPFFVTDPVDSSSSHAFNDLERRRQKLAALAGKHCITLILVPPRRRLLEERLQVGPRFPLPSVSDPRVDGINDPVRMTH